jgi:hypothetical protein
MLSRILSLALASLLALAATTPVAQSFAAGSATDKLVVCHFMVSFGMIDDLSWTSCKPAD